MLDEAVRIGELLQKRGWWLAVAESCTAGLLSHLITEIPGSSAYFLGGVSAYADAMKQSLLGVRTQSLQRWGAVSVQVALEMAEGVRKISGAELGLSITGIAGPGGATLVKPVGLTYIALAAPGERRVWRQVWSGDRSFNKLASAQVALNYACAYLSGSAASGPSFRDSAALCSAF